MKSLTALPPTWWMRRTTLSFCCSIALLVFVFVAWHYHPQYDWARPSATASLPQDVSPIPRKIWQIWFKQTGASNRYVAHPELRNTASWIGMNPDHKYTLVGRQWGDDFVREHFAGDKALVDTYLALQNHGLKSDLLRYLLLYTEGGVYTDIDTVALQPVERWVPAGRRLRAAAHAVVGIEFDRLDGPAWADIPHDLQFCQWTIAAAPGHAVFRAMADRALASLRALAAAQGGGPVASLGPVSSFDTMNSTGPAAWTDVVFDHIRRADPAITSLRNLSGLSEPRLYGDILVLPINGFGMGQVHSGSTNDGSIPDAALLKHLFSGSWRHD